MANPGALDASFAGDGKKAIDFGGDVESVEGAALQPDGKIVLAGGSDGGSRSRA